MPCQLRDTNVKIILPSLPTTNPKTSTILKFRTAFSASHHPISTSAPTPRLPIDALHLVQTVHTTPNYPSRFGIIQEDREIGSEPRYVVFPSRNAQRTKMTSTPTLGKWIILKRGGSGDGSPLFPLFMTCTKIQKRKSSHPTPKIDKQIPSTNLKSWGGTSCIILQLPILLLPSSSISFDKANSTSKLI